MSRHEFDSNCLCLFHTCEQTFNIRELIYMSFHWSLIHTLLIYKFSNNGYSKCAAVRGPLKTIQYFYLTAWCNTWNILPLKIKKGERVENTVCTTLQGTDLSAVAKLWTLRDRMLFKVTNHRMLPPHSNASSPLHGLLKSAKLLSRCKNHISA